MIKLNDLNVIFNLGTPLENHALKNLSLEIPSGEFVTVIGSNGAGKSSLLNSISGEISCHSGEILLDSSRITAWPVHKRANNIARVFQEPLTGTCESLSIEENMSLALSRGEKRGLSWASRRNFQQQFTKQLQRLNLGLEHRLSDKVGLLSGGQRQALSLLMATLRPMKLLLLDEHTAALDPKTADFILELTEELVTTQKLTTLMVTHSMKQALQIGSRTIMLHQGKIAMDIGGAESASTTQQDLLDRFHKNHASLDSDTLLLT